MAGYIEWSREYSFLLSNLCVLLTHRLFISALDSLTSFSDIKGTSVAPVTSSGPVRYAVRQVLDQEYRNNLLKRQAESRQARYGFPASANKTGDIGDDANGKENSDAIAKASRLNAPRRDFFGRIIVNNEKPAGQDSKPDLGKRNQNVDGQNRQEKKAWVSYHEGFSNAVRKRITVHELLFGL